MEGRQQALMFRESGEQERTLRGHEFASKGSIAAVSIAGSAVARKVDKAIGRVMVESSSFMVAFFQKT
jgi:hypothetical protein